MMIVDIRNIINIISTEELSDDAIQSAIDRSDLFVDDLATSCSATPQLIQLTKLNYAAFLAYQTYSDRVVHEYQGEFSSEGVREPIVPEISRDTSAKLSSLERTYKENVAAMKASTSIRVARMPNVHHRDQVIPAGLMMSDRRTSFGSHRNSTDTKYSDDW
jgi:hypothetical protein